MAESEADERARMTREYERMQAAILDGHHAWAWFECGFAWLLRNALRSDHPDAAGHIYFAPAATETRLAIVDAVVRLVVTDHPLEERFLVQWAGVLNRAGRIRQTRNTIIHGQVVGVRRYPKDRSRTRLVAVLADTRRTIEQQRGRQLPGLSINDVRQNAEAMKRMGEDTLLVQQFVDAVWAGDDATSLQRLAELEARHRTDSRTKGGRTRTAPDAPPPSSAE